MKDKEDTEYEEFLQRTEFTPEDLAKAMYEEAPLKTSPYGYAWDELDSLGYVSFKIGQVKAAKRIMIKLGIE